MKIKALLLILFVSLIAIPNLKAQENKAVILNLKNGYTVKGVLLEQTEQFVKIKTQDGQIFEYGTDEIQSISGTKASSTKSMQIGTADLPNLFVKDNIVLNVGIGIGSTLYRGIYNKTRVPPISASLEFGFMDDLFDVEKLNLGLGGYVGFTSAKYEYNFWGSNWGWEYSSFIIGARGALHYPFIDNFDTYSGLLLGFNLVTNKSFGNVGVASPTKSSIAYSWFLGGRYYFTDNIAGMVELGYGIAYLNLGVALKF